MSTYFNIAIIIISVGLILSILFQVKGGGLGGYLRSGGYGLPHPTRGRENTIPISVVLAIIIYRSCRSWQLN